MRDRDTRLERAAGPLALGLLLAGLAAWSWRKWADVHIDFGNELYVAWRLSEGDALYRDIAQRAGPLSHYANALLFALFGAGIRTLVWANLAVLGAIAALLFRLFARACDRPTATLCVAVLFVVFAFGQYGAIGNFNYVTPYHHSQTHGLALGLAQLACFAAAARRASARWLFAAGLCLGAVFLTKAELFVPCAAMALAAFAARWRGAWRTGASPGRELVWFASGAALPLAGFAWLLGLRMPPGLALSGLLGNWLYLSDVGSDAFYRRGAGLDDAWGNALRLVAAGALALACAGLLAVLDHGFARLRARLGLDEARARGLVVSLGALAFVGLCQLPIPWWRSAASLPALAVGAVLWLGRGALGAAAVGERLRLYPLWLLAVYATTMLAKLALAPRFDHYGFVLAMPATLLGVAGLTGALPAALRRRHAGGGLARALAIAVLAAACVAFLQVSQLHYAVRSFEIGRGADAMLAPAPGASPRPQLLAQTLAFLEARLVPGDTLLVMPEGAQLNYWLRVRNPSRFLLFLPTEIRAFGEAAMRADLAAQPPDYVVLVHRLGREFGVGPFGSDPRNGRALRAWVDAHYRRVQRFGAEPFGDDGFGVVVLERSDRSAR